MFNFRDAVFAVAALVYVGLVSAQSASPYAGIGRAATPKEVAAWDIDVRPDFKGLPAGSGSVSKGQDVWESKCSSCHGIFGESNVVFMPLIGGTTAEDVKSGRVAKLLDPTTGRTMLMKLATVSTLWDYINRAMPWNQPKSLTTEEVYAVTAFLLNLGGVIPDDYTLSDKNIAEVQARMPNRNGMTTQHAMWPGREFNGARQPDVRNTACMKNCATEPSVASLLPDFARNAHGNLAEQNRAVGAQHGVDTSRPEGQKSNVPAATISAVSAPSPAVALTRKNNCTACHAMDSKILGPSFTDIAKKHAGKAEYLAGKIKSGGAGVWGSIPMPAQTLTDADANAIAVWLAAGAGR
jgi:cytochrome c551/c552/cytochrome c5